MSQILRRTDPTKSLIYMIGNCEGRTDLLLKMFNKLNAEPIAANDKIVIVGSVITEHTKDIKGTINTIRGFMHRYEGQVTFIRGANEQRLLMNKKQILKSPLGIAMLDSYRTGSMIYYLEGKRRPKLEPATMVKDMLWLQENSKKFLMTDNYFICSSGVAPTKDLPNQVQNALMFLRVSFASSNRVYDKVIVHGNSTNKKPKIKDTRIDLSSSPHDTGVLACVVVDDTKRELFEVITTVGETKQKREFNKTSKDTTGTDLVKVG